MNKAEGAGRQGRYKAEGVGCQGTYEAMGAGRRGKFKGVTTKTKTPATPAAA